MNSIFVGCVSNSVSSGRDFIPFLWNILVILAVESPATRVTRILHVSLFFFLHSGSSSWLFVALSFVLLLVSSLLSSLFDALFYIKTDQKQPSCTMIEQSWRTITSLTPSRSSWMTMPTSLQIYPRKSTESSGTSSSKWFLQPTCHVIFNKSKRWDHYWITLTSTWTSLQPCLSSSTAVTSLIRQNCLIFIRGGRTCWWRNSFVRETWKSH